MTMKMIIMAMVHLNEMIRKITTTMIMTMITNNYVYEDDKVS